MMMEESFLKGQILTRGVSFSLKALQYAVDHNAKKQNMVYNAPNGANLYSPQELVIRHLDGYETVVSCVAPNKREPVLIDVIDGKLVAFVREKRVNGVLIEFVEEPEYYSIKLTDGTPVKDYVSACGYDELNILPFKGCAISKGCLFCGINMVSAESMWNGLTVKEIGADGVWDSVKERYFRNLVEAIGVASKSSCYKEHMHLIIISGDLSNNKLDLQSRIYSEIAAEIHDYVTNASEGIVAVLMPPQNKDLLEDMKKSGIRNVVFNLEVANKELFGRFCPGKNEIGYEHIIESLYAAADIFGKGHSWSNFVLGLEPMDGLLALNRQLAMHGVVSSANVLHLDKGNRLDCDVPAFDDVVRYFYELSQILKEYNYKPYYCGKALRTSLSNEAYDGRIIL